MKIIFTMASINNDYEKRKEECVESYNVLKSYGLNPIVVECFQHDKNMCYIQPDFITNTHTNSNNKGYLECIAIKKLLSEIVVDENEDIVKITGRYIMESNNFFNIVNESESDTCCKTVDDNTQMFFGLFSSKYNILNSFLNKCDLDHMNRNMINVEKYYFDYIKQKQIKIEEVDKLNIRCRIFGRNENKKKDELVL